MNEKKIENNGGVFWGYIEIKPFKSIDSICMTKIYILFILIPLYRSVIQNIRL